MMTMLLCLRYQKPYRIWTSVSCSYTEEERDSWRAAIESASHAQVSQNLRNAPQHHHHYQCHHHQQQHKHPQHQMRQRLAVLEARLSQLRPEEPRPPTSSSHSIGSKSSHQSLDRVMWLFLQVSWWKQNLSQIPRVLIIMIINSDPESPALLECALSCDNLLCDVLGRPPSTRSISILELKIIIHNLKLSKGCW